MGKQDGREDKGKEQDHIQRQWEEELVLSQASVLFRRGYNEWDAVNKYRWWQIIINSLLQVEDIFREALAGTNRQISHIYLG